MRDQTLQIGFIGTGTIGGRLIRALLQGGSIAPTNIWAANRSRAKVELLAEQFKGLRCSDPSTVAAESHILFLCMKPADTATVLKQIEDKLHGDQVCVFLTNVFSFEQIEARIPCRVAKLIPSVAQQAGRGVALLSYGSRITAKESEKLEQLLAPTGKLMVIPEHHLRVFADVASCGPAFLAAVIDELCLQAAKKTSSVSTSDLTEAAIETLAATAELLRSGLSPSDLVRQVAVPGGMTEAGLQALRENLPQVIAAVLEATDSTEKKKRATTPLGSRQ